MQKSTPPTSATHLSTAPFKSSYFRTSTPPMPITLAPGRTLAISAAASTVLLVLRPTTQAFAPRRTRARTWALTMVPAPPVAKRVLFALR